MTGVGPCRTQRAEPVQAGLLERPLGLLCPAPYYELVPDELAIVTIDHRGQVGPAVLPTGYVSHVNHPARVVAYCLATPPRNPGPRGRRPLMHEPTLRHPDAIDRLGREANSVPKAEPGPEAPI